MNTNSSWHDPVVAEIRATRERFGSVSQLAYSKTAEARCRALGLNMAEDQHLHSVSLTSDTPTPEFTIKSHE